MENQVRKRSLPPSQAPLTLRPKTWWVLFIFVGFHEPLKSTEETWIAGNYGTLWRTVFLTPISTHLYHFAKALSENDVGYVSVQAGRWLLVTLSFTLIHHLPLTRGRVRALPLALPGEPRGIPSSTKRHSPSRVSWVFPWASSFTSCAYSTKNTQHHIRFKS